MLSVYFNSTDISLSQSDINVDEFTTIVTTGDFLYIGYYKPINSTYVHMETPNVNPANLTVEYYNGTAFTAINGLVDRTVGFTRSSWIDWNRNQDDETTTTINSVDQFWYRLSVDSDTSSITLNGINLIFSNDDGIKGQKPWLLDSRYYASGTTSYIGYHQEARDIIIQRMRNEGKVKLKNSKLANINQFDILDRQELQLASKYIALSLIYSDRLSDAPGDKYSLDAQRYMSMGIDNLANYLLSLDKDDDGVADLDEPSVIVHRIVRS